MGKRLLVSIVALILLGAAAVGAQTDSVKSPVPDSDTVIESGNNEQVIAYYFHGERRCATCQKLEAYSEEAIAQGFAELLKDSSLVWRVVNFEESENEHFAKGYELYSQAVILSRVSDGKEIGWVNLDKIWTLVGDKEKFVAYIQTETERFLNESEE